MKYFLFLLLVVIAVTPSFAQNDCTYTFPNNLDQALNISDILATLDCASGDIIFDNVNSKPDGTGSVIFDVNVTLNSLTINFSNGNQPSEFIIPSGVTVNITTDLTFAGQPDKDKFLTVEGALIVGNTVDFGGLEIEIDGEGSIDADEIIGSDDATCTAGEGGTGTCPTFNVPPGSCEPAGSGLCGDSALPIELLSFNAKISNKSIQLTWSTASEENFDFFTIERSSDAKDYEIVGTVPGHGWSDKIIEYTFSDNAPLLGRAYYRLKATDFDGTFEYFKPVMVNNNNGSRAIRLSSNPVGEQPLKFQLNFQPKEEIYFSVTDLSGVEVLSGTLMPGLSQYTIEKQLEKGMYLLRVSSGNDSFTSRFLKR